MATVRLHVDSRMCVETGLSGCSFTSLRRRRPMVARPDLRERSKVDARPEMDLLSLRPALKLEFDADILHARSAILTFRLDDLVHFVGRGGAVHAEVKTLHLVKHKAAQAGDYGIQRVELPDRTKRVRPSGVIEPLVTAQKRDFIFEWKFLVLPDFR